MKKYIIEIMEMVYLISVHILMNKINISVGLQHMPYYWCLFDVKYDL